MRATEKQLEYLIPQICLQQNPVLESKCFSLIIDPHPHNTCTHTQVYTHIHILVPSYKFLLFLHWSWSCVCLLQSSRNNIYCGRYGNKICFTIATLSWIVLFLRAVFHFVDNNGNTRAFLFIGSQMNYFRWRDIPAIHTHWLCLVFTLMALPSW